MSAIVQPAARNRAAESAAKPEIVELLRTVSGGRWMGGGPTRAGGVGRGDRDGDGEGDVGGAGVGVGDATVGEGAAGDRLAAVAVDDTSPPACCPRTAMSAATPALTRSSANPAPTARARKGSWEAGGRCPSGGMFRGRHLTGGRIAAAVGRIEDGAAA